jgi:alkylresorcinol/alkylpyrone synthase
VGKIESGFGRAIEGTGPAAQEEETSFVRIASVASAVPEYRFPQEVITAAFKGYWNTKLQEPEKLDWLHSRVGVDFRHLAFPLDRYPQFSTWGEANAAWLEAAEELGERAIDVALDRAGMSRQDLNALSVVSITGIASPSLDARLINRMKLRPDIKRTPIFGIGCAGGAIGLTRAADYAVAYPDHTAAILCVEICSLTMQPEDFSTANLIASGLFGDGAAAVIVRGSRTAHRSSNGPSQSSRPGPQILGTASMFYPDTEEIMGWDISETGFKIVLSPQLPELIKGRLAGDIDGFLGKYQLRRADIGNWVIHTGGPKVLDSIQGTLELKDSDLDRSWECLRQFGNLSSASVLLVLEEVLMNDTPSLGTYGVLMAMGPGFCLEMILLKW